MEETEDDLRAGQGLRAETALWGPQHLGVTPTPKINPPLSLFTSSEQQKLRLGGGRRAVSLEARRRRVSSSPARAAEPAICAGRSWSELKAAQRPRPWLHQAAVI